MHTNSALLLPATTESLLHPNGWILIVPVPWWIYAVVLSRRRDLAPNAVFAFAGTVILALALLICVVSLACVLPFIALHGKL
jgi:hypothetical protein